MIRILSILSVLTVIMILLAGGGVYWLSQSSMAQSEQKFTQLIASSIARHISSDINMLQEVVVKMAIIPEVVMAIEAENPQQMAETAIMLEQFLPKIMKIRLFTENASELDQVNFPHMGNADLIMVQETLMTPQQPVIQGQGKHRHLAITAVVKKDGMAIGTILASLEFDFLKSTLKQYKSINGFFDVKQGKISLAMAGNEVNKTDLNNSVAVLKTPWSIYYGSMSEKPLAELTLIISIIIIPVLLICLIFFISYKILSKKLIKDRRSILQAIQDKMAEKTAGNYPIELNEMKVIMSTMIRYKREVDKKGYITITGGYISNTNSEDNFFDDDLNSEIITSDFEEMSFSNVPSSFDEIKGQAISLPVMLEQKTKEASKPDLQPAFNELSDATPSIYRAYDIRGIVGKTLTKEIVFDIGCAVGSEAKEKNIKTIIIGRDALVSSPSFSKALAEGITSTGRDVLDIGKVPSPVVYFVAQHTEGGSAVVVTGSHNPIHYNGLKIVIDGETLAGDKLQKLKQRIDNKNVVSESPAGSVQQNTLFISEYIGSIIDDVRIARPMKVVIDSGNGVTGGVAPVLFKTLGCEVIELFCEIDGSYPNHTPNPSNPETLSDLIATVRYHQADIGIAFDGDGDKLGIVDSKGKIIWPDRLMMLFAKSILASNAGAKILYDIKCSRHLPEQITQYHGDPILCKTGHSFMKAKLKETGAILAGEMSGHIFFNDRWFGFDDGLYVASRLIEILSEDTRSSNEVFRDFPDSVNTAEIIIELAEGTNTHLMEQLTEVANFKEAKIIDIDGLRVEFKDGWGVVRASNTIPALTLRFEADNKDALKRIQSQFKKWLTQVKPDISIPF